MQAERDALNKRAFPALRQLCEVRGVSWHEVDLRWGLPLTPSAEEPILHLCLREIDECRPFFIGILGDRYGWTPEITTTLRERYPWLGNLAGKSVTEIEIRYGALAADIDTLAFFYLKKSATLSFDAAEQNQRDGGQEQLAKLKAEIRASRFPVREYVDPDDLAKFVYDDLASAVEELCPCAEATNWLDREWQEHARFAFLRARFAFRRQRYFRRLDEYVEKGGAPLLVLGEPGVGKSTLLADWVSSRGIPRDEMVSGFSGLQRFGRLFPFVRNRREGRRRVWVCHFAGATSSSTQLGNVLARIAEEMKRFHELSFWVPKSIRELRASFPVWLAHASDKGTTVILIDGLDQFERDNIGDVFSWLPQSIPEQVRLIVSASNGTDSLNLEQQRWSHLILQPLEPSERREFVSLYLDTYGKQLDANSTDIILGATAASSPLFLRLLLDELRLLGSPDAVRNAAPAYAQRTTVRDLFQSILARFELDYETSRHGLVSDAVRFLWASRNGLEETELLHLLSTDTILPHAVWSPLALAFHDSLIARSGKLGFFHEELRQAVESRYLHEPNAKLTARGGLVNYFSRLKALQKVPSNRVLDEFPWQLSKTKDWQQLATVLSDPAFFSEMWRRDSTCVAMYWAKIEVESDLRLVDFYRKSAVVNPVDWRAAWNMMLLLEQTGHAKLAVELGMQLIEVVRSCNEPESLRALLINQAISLRAAGLLREANDTLRQLEEACRAADELRLLQICLANRGIVLRELGALDTALAMHREEESICRTQSNRYGEIVSQQNQALVLLAQGNASGAVRPLQTCEDFFRIRGDLTAQQACLGNIGIAHFRLGKRALALRAYEKEEVICRQIAAKRELQICLGHKATALQELGDDDAADRALSEQERICRELEDAEAIASCLLSRATFWLNIGPAGQERAQRCLLEAIQLAEARHLDRCLAQARELLKTCV